MIRRNAASVKVKAPSRGLVTRLPPNLADLVTYSGQYSGLTIGDANRACAVAQNVRFEDGVMMAAPGYQVATLTGGATNGPALTGLAAHWRLDEASGTRADATGIYPLTEQTTPTTPHITSVTGKIGSAVNFTDVATALVGGANATTGLQLNATDWTVSFWVNSTNGNGSVIAKAGGSPALEYTINLAGYEVTVFFTDANGGTHLTTSSNSLTSGVWGFVCVTYVKSTGALNIFVNGTTTTATVAAGVGVHGGTGAFQISGNCLAAVDSVSVWKRALAPAEVSNLYNGGAALDYPFMGGPFTLLYQGSVIGATPAPFFAGNNANLYYLNQGFSAGPPASFSLALSQLYSSGAPASGYRWTATSFIDKVVFAQNGSVPQYWASGFTATKNVPGLSTTASAFNGVESFFGHLIFWNGNQAVWSDLNDFTNYIPVGTTSNVLTLTTNGSFTQPALGSNVTVTINTIGSVTLAAGGYYRLNDATGVNYYQVVSNTSTTVTLTLLSTTGASPPGTVFATASLLVPLPANEAGQVQVAGSDVNGPILAVKATGQYAYIFRNRSIQSMQYVGINNGVFYLRTEVTNEGLLAPYAWVNVGIGQFYFLGQRELYSYGGGPTPTPVCRQYTRQLFSELNRNQLSQVVMLHRELRNEIWLVYPALGGVMKVLVWNYLEDTATIDLYASALNGLTAVAMVDWVTDPAWDSLSAGDTWASYNTSVTWAGFVGGGAEREAVMAAGDGTLLIHGNVYDRNGLGYTALAETMDYDFGDAAAFKYVDVVNVTLQVQSPTETVSNLYVQVGYRSTMDANPTWTNPVAIQVQGNANFTAKVNPGGGGGRFIRARFYSQDPDVAWRIAGFELYARKGGTY